MPGAEQVTTARSWLVPASFAALVMSLAVTHWANFALRPSRVTVRLFGLGYWYRWVPTSPESSRLKQCYLIKNTDSVALLIVT